MWEIWWMYFVFIYENTRLKPVEIVLRRKMRENDGGGKLTIKHICKSHNVMYPPVQLLYMLIKFLK
jgi:hypothetical protein